MNAIEMISELEKSNLEEVSPLELLLYGILPKTEIDFKFLT